MGAPSACADPRVKCGSAAARRGVATPNRRASARVSRQIARGSSAAGSACASKFTRISGTCLSSQASVGAVSQLGALKGSTVPVCLRKFTPRASSSGNSSRPASRASRRSPVLPISLDNDPSRRPCECRPTSDTKWSHNQPRKSGCSCSRNPALRNSWRTARSRVVGGVPRVPKMTVGSSAPRSAPPLPNPPPAWGKPQAT